ncbi:hypothetical protein Nepgr_004337 [Nepenthes gracilis]|uniref:Uncharacterized protein n=1 Tax=Nepenthes gracilis TaxID=150966 RepID=A0AAD3S160_NEPGR|nr:hypothetical protein Nepgr_004337 [Nepenthes gracilis]
MLPSPGANSSLQGSPGISVGSNFTSPSAQLNILGWAGRYGVPRTTSLPVDEQQRIQQYSHMLSNRSIQHLSVPGSFSGTDQNIHMLSDGNAMSMMPGMNRSMPMPRPGFRGISSSAMLNSETMVSSSMIGMSRTINIKTGAGPVQGNSMLRHHDALHLVRPGQNAEHQKQIMLREMQLQMQQTQEKSQGVPPFADLSSALANQSVSPPVDTYPAHHRPHLYQVPQQHSKVLSNFNHPHLPGSTPSITGEQKACALRIARERQLQQRMLQRQQQQQNQFPASNALMSNVQTQSEPPLSFSSQNSSQIPSLSTSLPASLPPLTLSPMQPTSSQQQQKHQLRPQGLGQNPQSGVSGATNQIGKQRQRQPQLQPQQFQQTGRRHPQQCQQLESLQHAKLLKGIGRDNMLINQNIPLDPSHLNGLSATPVNQLMEKGEQPMHLIQGKGLYSGSGMNSVQQSKPAVPSQPSRQSLTKQKPYPSSTPASMKQVQKIPSHPESSNQSQVPAVPSAVGLPASSQAVYPSMIPSLSNQQLQVQPKPVLKLVNKRQATIQRSIKQNLIVGSDPMAHSQAEQAQNSTPPLGTNSGSLAVCIESVNLLPLPSSASRPNTAPSKTSESLCHSVMANFSTQMGPTRGPSIPISSMNEPLPSGSAGLGHGQLSSNLPSSAQGVEAQWQQQQQQQQQSQLQPPPQLQPVLQQNQSHQQQQLEQSPERLLPLQLQS